MNAFLPAVENVVFYDMETTGLDPFQNRIISIQVRSRGKTTIWKEWQLGEIECVESFFDYLSTLKKRETSLVGYNVLKFDVSFLDQRLRLLQRMNNWKWRTLHKWTHWIDLYQFLGDAYCKASFWYSSMLGVRQSVVNADIPRLYAERSADSLQVILDYVEEEMRNMELVYEQIKSESFYKELVELRRKLVDEN